MTLKDNLTHFWHLPDLYLVWCLSLVKISRSTEVIAEMENKMAIIALENIRKSYTDGNQMQFMSSTSSGARKTT